MLRSLAFGAVIGLAIFLTGCCTDPVNGESYFCLGEVSDAEEASLGQQYAPTFIAESGGLYPDPELHAYLNDIVIGMAKISHRPDLPWEFHILNTSQINAFALPGGQVFVTRGLLSKLENEAQFAHLMGHEIGHVTHRHSVRGQGRAALFSILLGVVAVAEDQMLDPEDPHLITPAAAGLGQLTLLKFSRDQELQSDRRGVDYALQLGYDPLEGRKTFEMFLELKGGGESMIDGLLSTHPLDSDRIDQIQEYVADEHPERPTKLIVSRPTFDAHQQEIVRVQGIYEQHDRAMALIDQAQKESKMALLDEAEALLRDGASKLPKHGSFQVGLGVIALTRNDNNAALNHFDRATRSQPDLFMGVLYRGVARDNLGQSEAARIDFERAHELHATHPLPCYLLGKLSEQQNRGDEAVEWYTRALERSPQDSPIASKSQERLNVLQGAAPTA